MPQQLIELGALPGGIGGDTIRSANVKCNANFTELYRGQGALGTASLRNTGTSGAVVPLLNASNSFQGTQRFTVGATPTSLSWSAEFVMSSSIMNAGRVVFHQGATYGLCVSATSTGSTSGFFNFQVVDLASGALHRAPLTMNVDGTLIIGGHVNPIGDNTYNMGSASRRIKEVFAGSGIINTSDAREKTIVRPLSTQELAAARDLSKEIGAFKFLSALAEKGESARQHIGMTVQRAIEVMKSHNLDPFSYSFICYDAWEETTVTHPAEYAAIKIPAECDEAGNEIIPCSVENGELIKEACTEVLIRAGDRYAFRMDELLAFIAAGFEARLSALEAG
ncbi:tail fiber domain-containing protein [Pseudomonas sp. 21LCFQ010]|uniref:tail fiber domain-containing protein n=1 Tax=Pseudomonas sp. 21LCFQ010 TaxID=2957506 RepID=UPI0020985747|nr:tail fiber domain-containing protein [Pseudomonas sp. 21LCFQ010]MCO8164855.1 tail fiber domain-containing protein [Pseudomonas sp. 21LCFQ010]